MKDTTRQKLKAIDQNTSKAISVIGYVVVVPITLALLVLLVLHFITAPSVRMP
jgi:hypothetical protein